MRIKTIRAVPIILALSVILAFSAFAAGEPVILSQPQSVYLPSDTELPVSVTFAVLASGEDLSYNWQFSNDNGVTWYNGSSSTSSYSPTINDNSVNGGRLYRVTVSNQDGEVVSSVVSVTVGAYLMDSIPQLLSYVTDIGNAIFGWVGQSCTAIVSEPLLLFTCGFLAIGGCIALVGRLLSRS